MNADIPVVNDDGGEIGRVTDLKIEGENNVAGVLNEPGITTRAVEDTPDLETRVYESLSAESSEDRDTRTPPWKTPEGRARARLMRKRKLQRQARRVQQAKTRGN